MRVLGEVAAIDKTVNEQLREYEDFSFKFGELAAMLETYITKLEYDPAELDDLEKRLATISKLKRRHACDSLEELIDLKERMRDEYNSITGSSEKKLKLEREIEQLREEIGGTAFVLSHKRSEAANRLEKKIQVHLHELGMAKTRFVISIQQEQTPTGLVRYKEKRWRLWSTGADRVEFLFTANVGESPKPLKAIASGGEISRIMLAIRAILAEVDRVPVIIFDEIDAGVGASMGMPIAEKLAAVADNQQVICVTHLPHIAAMANNHIVVDKVVESRRTHTIVSFPSGQDRVHEVARMLGGDATGQISIKHAKELLALSRKNR
jgi:DNA repair protein RecN (Recombination protein N)